MWEEGALTLLCFFTSLLLCTPGVFDIIHYHSVSNTPPIAKIVCVRNVRAKVFFGIIC